MALDLSGYPPTKKGVREMVEALKPQIIDLWKAERQTLQTDDLIVIINASTGVLRVETRASIYQQIKKHAPDQELLETFAGPPPEALYGTIRIWALVGFQTGQMCCLPLSIAYS